MVLAAGESKRFGSPKQLALFHGQPMLSHVCAECLKTVAEAVIVVVGASAERIVPVLPSGVSVVTNEAWPEGMAGSIRAGVERVNSEAVVLVLGDQPMVTEAQMVSLVRALGSPADVAASQYPDGSLGVPATFGRNHFAALQSLQGSSGAKGLFNEATKRVPCHEIADVDTPGDLIELGG
ncbi:MAG TPA: nucleotidyltransferase family protein [Fimbriimonas sp.]|nr:nucleotidyltransferase family protein [Fimbriimonas sp.]